MVTNGRQRFTQWNCTPTSDQWGRERPQTALELAKQVGRGNPTQVGNEAPWFLMWTGDISWYNHTYRTIMLFIIYIAHICAMYVVLAKFEGQYTTNIRLIKLIDHLRFRYTLGVQRMGWCQSAEERLGYNWSWLKQCKAVPILGEIAPDTNHSPFQHVLTRLDQETWAIGVDPVDDHRNLLQMADHWTSKVFTPMESCENWFRYFEWSPPPDQSIVQVL